ncbi:MAG: BatA domain-containing protein [Candidatus Kapaibacteriota bacterium]
MTFLNPLVLIGLIAAAIPVILHLLNLRKLKTIDFSTLRFIKELQKTSIRKLKTQQILLLILRTLIIICCVLAFSRPTIKSSFPALGSHAKTSIIVILDNSLSMDVSDAGGNRFAKAKGIAKQIALAMKEGDEMAFLPLSSIANQRKRSFSRNPEFLLKEINASTPAYSTATLNDGLRASQGLLDASLNIHKEVYLITDIQQSQHASIVTDSLQLFDDQTAVYVIPMQNGNPSTNVSIDTIMMMTTMFEKGKSADIQARLTNSGSTDIRGLIISMLFNEQRVAQKSIDISAGTSTTVTLSAPPSMSGIVRVRMMIEPDALEHDNVRHAAFIIPPPPIVGAIASGSAAEFLRLATSNAISSYASYSADQAGTVNYEEHDIIIVAGALNRNEASRLDAFIQSGGTALIFPDDRLDPAEQIPALTMLGLAPLQVQAFSERSPGLCTSVDRQHPLFRGVFKGLEMETSLGDSPKIKKALTGGGGQSLIQMQGGSFLTEVRRGEGKILYCAVPPSPAWSSFPYSGLLPTLLYRSMQYLSAKEMLTSELITGDDAIALIPTKAMKTAEQMVRVSDPKGTESQVQGNTVPGGLSVRIGRLNNPGVYAIRNKEGESLTALSVNIPVKEGHLAYASDNDLLKAIKNRVKSPSLVQELHQSSRIGDSVAKARVGTELWRLFLILALCFAITEMIIARRVGRSTSE